MSGAHKVTSADGGWPVLFALVAQWPAAAEFLRSASTQAMKKSIIIIGLAVVLLVIGITVFWPRVVTGTTSVQLSGTSGASFTGYYVRDGRRVAVSGVLPWSFDTVGVSKFEFRKGRADELFAFAAHYDETGGAHAMQSRDLAPGVVGIRGRVHHHGLSTESITR
jgi:hypothetical protein